MRPALVIARKDLRQRLRDRSAVVVGFIAPVVIAGIMSVAFKGADSFHYILALVNADGGPVSAGLVGALHEPQLTSLVTVVPARTAAAARAEVNRKAADAVLVIPSGFSAAAVGTHPEALTTITSLDNTLAGDITNSIAASFLAQLNADRLSVATARAAGASPDRVAALVGRASHLRIPLVVVNRPVGAHQLKVISYYAPAMAIFFLLFMIAYTARSFFVDKAQGMVERMRAAPLRPAEIIIGKSLSVFVFGIVSLGLIALVTSKAFGADWGDPLAVVLLICALVAAVVSLTALVIVLSKTQRQAEAFSSILVFGLALLGGNFVYVSSAPAIMQRLALATPNGWAMRGFTDLATVGGGLSTIAEPLVAILVFTAVVTLVVTRLANRAVTA